MIVRILGPGCADCATLEKVTREAVAALGIDASVEKVTDYGAIAGYGVMRTPALVVDEQLILSGWVPTESQVRERLAPDRLTGPAAPGGRLPSSLRRGLPVPRRRCVLICTG